MNKSWNSDQFFFLCIFLIVSVEKSSCFETWTKYSFQGIGLSQTYPFPFFLHSPQLPSYVSPSNFFENLF